MRKRLRRVAADLVVVTCLVRDYKRFLAVEAGDVPRALKRLLDESYSIGELFDTTQTELSEEFPQYSFVNYAKDYADYFEAHTEFFTKDDKGNYHFQALKAYSRYLTYYEGTPKQFWDCTVATLLDYYYQKKMLRTLEVID